MKRFPLFLGWILWLMIFSAGCTDTSPISGVHSPPPPTATPEAIRSAEPAAGATPVSEWIRGLEEAIQRGDWKKAQAVYETAGRPPLSADPLNRAMAQGIYLAWSAREAGNHWEADQQIQGVRNLVRSAVIPRQIPEGFQEEFYFYLTLADSDVIDAWGKGKRRSPEILSPTRSSGGWPGAIISPGRMSWGLRLQRAPSRIGSS